MEFVKKNYLKITAALLLTVVAVLTLISLFGYLGLSNALSDVGAFVDTTKSGIIAQILIKVALIIIFACLIAALVLKMFGKNKLANILILCGSVVALIMFVVAAIVGAPALKEIADSITTYKNAADALKNSVDPVDIGTRLGALAQMNSAIVAYQTQLFGTIINIVVFALLPLIYSVKKLFVKETR